MSKDPYKIIIIRKKITYPQPTNELRTGRYISYVSQEWEIVLECMCLFGNNSAVKEQEEDLRRWLWLEVPFLRYDIEAKTPKMASAILRSSRKKHRAHFWR